MEQSTKSLFLSELQWRGLLHTQTPGLDEWLIQVGKSAYIGFDPTAESLHIGSLLPIMLLAHFQRAGHKPIAIVGGATGMIGDPSGKSQERNLLSLEQIQKNIDGIQKQLSHFLDFEGDNPAKILNNYDWFKNFTFLDFLRDVGKHLTVNYMIAKESVQKRMETGLSFTEFSYQLLQGYDFYYLSQNQDCYVQMGGSDQWGNMVAGIELTRRMAQKEAFAMTCPLVTKSDGSKFGKSEGGNIWLSAELTSPYKFYQFWINQEDQDVEKYLKYFTFLTKEEIQHIISEHQVNPGLRIAQKKLAFEITTLVHGLENTNKAIEASQALFSNGIEALKAFSKKEIEEIFEGVPLAQVNKQELENGIPIIDFLVQVGISKSKSEARRDIPTGSIKINREKVTDIQAIVQNPESFSSYFLCEKGKKEKVLVEII